MQSILLIESFFADYLTAVWFRSTLELHTFQIRTEFLKQTAVFLLANILIVRDIQPEYLYYCVTYAYCTTSPTPAGLTHG